MVSSFTLAERTEDSCSVVSCYRLATRISHEYDFGFRLVRMFFFVSTSPNSDADGVDSHENEVTPPALALNGSVSSSFKDEFRIKYETMNNEKKWKLQSSNRYVEDEIYKYAKDLPDEQ